LRDKETKIKLIKDKDAPGEVADALTSFVK
jgi:hypothetical protein